jgi:predicted ATPase
MSQRAKLSSLRISGFKSFAAAPRAGATSTDTLGGDGNRVELGDVTVFLGANGAGKSNIISLFKMLGFAMNGKLQEFIGLSGRASSLLHMGARTTPQLEIAIEFRGEDFSTRYTCTLADSAPDDLVFHDESIEYQREGTAAPMNISLGSGHGESKLVQPDDGDHPIAKSKRVVRTMLFGCKAYQFHDTSPTARIRKACYFDDSRFLRHDGGNLGPFLLAIKQQHPRHYDLIRRTVSAACPQFDDFDLEPSDRDRMLLLNWRAKTQPDYLFGPHQLSDGTLRFMALAALLLQPEDGRPGTILIDEPELGLHPTAIAILAGMVKQASVGSQIVLTTQSPTLVDHFELENIRPMAHYAGRSRFLALDAAELRPWLQEYSLGDMWQKNLFRGGPEHA